MLQTMAPVRLEDCVLGQYRSRTGGEGLGGTTEGCCRRGSGGLRAWGSVCLTLRPWFPLGFGIPKLIRTYCLPPYPHPPPTPAAKGTTLPGYLDDPTVPPGSLTPTFAACAVFINNARWDGVPFLLKAGKALHRWDGTGRGGGGYMRCRGGVTWSAAPCSPGKWGGQRLFRPSFFPVRPPNPRLLRPVLLPAV